MVYDVWAQKLPSLLEDGSLCHDCSAVVRLCSHSPAKAVGGDLYDFFVRDNELVFCVGDVSGKGVPAALFMMMTKSLFRAYAAGESMPDQPVTC